MTRACSVATCGALGLILLGGGLLRAQDEGEPDPCHGALTQAELRICWVREAEHAENQLKKTYEALLSKLPRDTRERLKKAQKAWLEFRDAHVNTVYGAADRARDPYRWTCLLMTRRQLTLARRQQLEQLLRPDADLECSL